MANKRRPRRPENKSLASTSYSPRFGSIFQPLSAVFHPSLSLLIRLLISAALLALLLFMRSYAEAQENTQFDHTGFPRVGSSNEPAHPLPSYPPLADPPASNGWLIDQP